MIDRRNMLIGCAALTASVSANANQNELSLIVGSGVGGSSDVSTRILAARLSTVGIDARVSNRPAGNGVEAAIHILSQPANSNALLSNGLGGIFLAPARERLTYDSDSLAPVCMFSIASFVFAVKSSSRFKTIHDLIAAGKSGSISIGNGGAETQYTVAKFAEASGTNVVNAVYRSGGIATQDLIAGVTDAAYISVASAAGLVSAGEVRMLAHTNVDGSHIPGFTEVPHIFTIGSNDPGLLSYGYHGLYASRNMPSSLINDIASKVEHVCRDDKFIDDHKTRGMMPLFKGPNDLREHHKIIQNNLVIPYMEWARRNAR